MSSERIFYCEAPECERHVRTASPRPRSGLLFVTDSSGGKTQHFCGWDCLMKYAATKPPEEIIPWGPPEEPPA